MLGLRRCSPCAMQFGGETQQEADKMFERHLRDSHPEYAQVSQLIERIDRVAQLLERGLARELSEHPPR